MNKIFILILLLYSTNLIAQRNKNIPPPPPSKNSSNKNINYKEITLEKRLNKFPFKDATKIEIISFNLESDRIDDLPKPILKDSIFDNKIEKMYGVIFSLIGIIPGGLLFAKGYFYNIVTNRFGITENTMFGNQNEIKWEEITDVTFSKINQEISIKSKKVIIKAHNHLIGFPVLVNKIEEKTDKSFNNIIYKKF